jgi:NADH-quinone oxidoreductase subunit M
VFASWNIDKQVKLYFFMFLLLETGMMGVFVAMDFFLFYIYWEVMLLPMYFLIGIWGGENKEYAAIKFFLYTLFGSVFMLVAMIAMYYYSDPGTFDFEQLAKAGFAGKTLHLWKWAVPLDKALWLALFLGFAIKVPMFPFHTWLPHAHVQAPTAISVILAGVLLKMGTYGVLRINYPLLPEATKYFALMIAIFGVINILYGAFCAMAQNDLKKLVAYSSVSHMGYCLLGMSAFTPEAMNGAMLQMFNHGTATAMMFLLVGVIYDRVHHRVMKTPEGTPGFGGIASIMPRYTGVFIVATFASLGLPGLSGFISEALVFLGAFKVYPEATAIAAVGVLITAAYLLWMVQRVFLGPVTVRAYSHDSHGFSPWKAVSDMNLRETLTLAPLVVIVVVVGIYPAPVLNMITASMNHLLTVVR